MSLKNKEVVKRLHVELPESTHYEIKKRSLERNISMKEWVMIAIDERIKEEQKYE